MKSSNSLSRRLCFTSLAVVLSLFLFSSNRSQSPSQSLSQSPSQSPSQSSLTQHVQAVELASGKEFMAKVSADTDTDTDTYARVRARRELQDTGVPGGEKTVPSPNEDEDVQKASLFLLQRGLYEHGTGRANDNFKDSASNSDSRPIGERRRWNLVRVLSARKQVVAGINIIMNVLCRDTRIDASNLAEGYAFFHATVNIDLKDNLKVLQWHRAASRSLSMGAMELGDKSVDFLTQNSTVCKQLKEVASLSSDMCDESNGSGGSSGTNPNAGLEPLSMIIFAFSESLYVQNQDVTFQEQDVLLISVPKHGKLKTDGDGNHKYSEPKAIAIVHAIDGKNLELTEILSYEDTHHQTCCACRSEAGPRFLMFCMGIVVAAATAFCVARVSMFKAMFSDCFGIGSSRSSSSSRGDGGVDVSSSDATGRGRAQQRGIGDDTNERAQNFSSMELQEI